uniref:Uncharacterized protein n=1 Tax=Mycobacterium riyadhense TaxID=486698 RepID=A0A653EZA4_9MYCO|nr:hypothetical protein BIN_B_04756 [Mycobacterium riyadhense]
MFDQIGFSLWFLDQQRLPVHHDIADEVLVLCARGYLGGDDCLSHLWVGSQDCFDFAGFDADSADLDLFIGTCEVIQLAIGTPAHHITTAVHPCAGGAERARHES